MKTLKLVSFWIFSSFVASAMAAPEPMKPALESSAPAAAPVAATTEVSASATDVPAANTTSAAPAAEVAVAPAAAPVASSETPAEAVPPVPAAPAKSGLEAQLEGLEMPANMAPAGVTQERLYSVQNRFAPLKGKSEIGIGGGYNFKGNGYMTMSELDLDYRYHFNDRWNINVGGGYNFNTLNTSGEELVKQHGLLPDAAYPKYRGHLLVGFNTFYGKLRFSMDSNAYFDQYIAIGPGIVSLDTGSAVAGVADVGFAFWLKKWGSMRIGVRNEVFNEKRTLTSSMVHHMVGHVDFAFMLGGGAK